MPESRAVAERVQVVMNLTSRLNILPFDDLGARRLMLGPMRGLGTERTASVVVRGHAFISNFRRGHYEFGVDATPLFRLATAFDELRPAI